MPYELENRLVIGVASSAVFDLVASDALFQSQGEEECRKFQQENLHVPLPTARIYSKKNLPFASSHLPLFVRIFSAHTLTISKGRFLNKIAKHHVKRVKTWPIIFIFLGVIVIPECKSLVLIAQ